LIARLSPLVREDNSKALPAVLDVPRAQIERWWDDWRLWRLAGRRFESFILARKLPKAMIKTFMFLDYFIGKMEEERDRKKAEAAAKKKR